MTGTTPLATPMTDQGDDSVAFVDEFVAPRGKVFAACTDADRIVKFFAPDGLSVPRESVTPEPHQGRRRKPTRAMGDRRCPSRASHRRSGRPPGMGIRSLPPHH